MTRLRNKIDSAMQLTWLVILAWFGLLTFQGNGFGQLGLGVLLLVGGIWSLAKSREVWNSYTSAWKKLPKSKRNAWNEPKEIYYLINVLLLIPLAIVLGLCLILLAYLTGI